MYRPEKMLKKRFYVDRKNDFGFRLIPKTASTSLLKLFFFIREGRPHRGALIEHVQLHKWGTIHNGMHQDVSNRFILLRDPVKRFLSGYSHQVQRRDVLGKKKIYEIIGKPTHDTFNLDTEKTISSKAFGTREIRELRQKLRYKINKFRLRKLLNDLESNGFSPLLNRFISNFELYCKKQPIAHHCLPLTRYLNEETFNAYTNFYKFEKLNELENDLSKIFQRNIKLNHEQTGAKKSSLMHLSEKMLLQLFEIFKDDYVLLNSFYTQESIYDEWKKSQAQLQKDA